MKKLLVAAVCAMLAMPAVSVADGDRNGWSSRGYHHDDRHDHGGGYRSYGYGGPAYPYYYGHDHHHDNDDALWAIGGLMLGAVIVSAIQQSSAPSRPVAAAPPVHRVETCYEDTVYDSAGNPQVQRRCYPANTP